MKRIVKINETGAVLYYQSYKEGHAVPTDCILSAADQDIPEPTQEGERLYYHRVRGFTLRVDNDLLVSMKVDKTDNDTRKEIEKGFVFDSHKFSLSIPAQMNWQRLNALKTAGLFGTSQDVSTLDNSIYSLLSARVAAFIAASNQKLDTAISAGRTKKKALVATG